ncbi:hypothetical protein [Sulfitobacter sp. EhC04]|nr:hypothetical protein [Sulfitobacter sp. EhC04]
MALVNYILAGMLGTVVAMAIYQHRVSFDSDAAGQLPPVQQQAV